MMTLKIFLTFKMRIFHESDYKFEDCNLDIIYNMALLKVLGRITNHISTLLLLSFF